LITVSDADSGTDSHQLPVGAMQVGEGSRQRESPVDIDTVCSVTDSQQLLEDQHPVGKE